MAIIKSFRDLEVYMMAREQAKKIFRISTVISERRKVFVNGSDTSLFTRG